MVEMILRCLLHKNLSYSHREQQLGIVKFVINNNPSQSMGYTPFFLDYGYHPVTPLDIRRDVDTFCVEFLQVFTRRMEQAFFRVTHHHPQSSRVAEDPN